MSRTHLMRKKECKIIRGNSGLLFLGLVLFLVSCQGKRKHPVEFYYWRTNFSLTPVEQNYFKELGCRKLYLRFFDVDKEKGEVVPKATLRPFDDLPINADYIPVVFITNRALQGLSAEEIVSLADKINKLVREIEEKNGLVPSPEIQIDCDWTERTREDYFRLLSSLQEQSGREITCTLRLHQIKFYRKTGVPPVSKGYLMCYATADPSETTTGNSILDMDLLKDYTAGIGQYPLDFEVALPLYSWAVVTNHLGKIKLINGVTEEELLPDDFVQVSPRVYGARKDLFLHGLYINKGFTLRLEGIGPELLQQAKTYLDSKIRRNYTILYYHLDESFLKKFTPEELQ